MRLPAFIHQLHPGTYPSGLNKPCSQRGDTLIEVLICILIVAVILSGAYVTTHKSSQGVRNSQEHAEALKLVQSQLEQIRQNAGITSGSTVFSIVPPFCMADSVAVSVAVSSGKCAQDSTGQPAAANVAPTYNISVGRTDCSSVVPKCYMFTVKATWETITGDGLSTEQISYRITDAH